MAPQTIRGYQIKYALSVGICEVDLEEAADAPGRFRAPGLMCMWLKLGKDVFLDREEAESAARKMALHKIASLEKQLNKMRTLAVKPKWKDKDPA